MTGSNCAEDLGIALVRPVLTTEIFHAFYLILDVYEIQERACLPEQVVSGEPEPENDESSEDRALEWERYDLKSSVP